MSEPHAKDAKDSRGGENTECRVQNLGDPRHEKKTVSSRELKGPQESSKKLKTLPFLYQNLTDFNCKGDELSPIGSQ